MSLSHLELHGECECGVSEFLASRLPVQEEINQKPNPRPTANAITEYIFLS